MLQLQMSLLSDHTSYLSLCVFLSLYRTAPIYYDAVSFLFPLLPCPLPLFLHLSTILYRPFFHLSTTTSNVQPFVTSHSITSLTHSSSPLPQRTDSPVNLHFRTDNRYITMEYARVSKIQASSEDLVHWFFCPNAYMCGRYII